MRHLLNNLSQEEKNNIKEQYTGEIKVITENFSRLLNSKLGDSKPLVNEDFDTDAKNWGMNVAKVLNKTQLTVNELDGYKGKPIGSKSILIDGYYDTFVFNQTDIDVVFKVNMLREEESNSGGTTRLSITFKLQDGRAVDVLRVSQFPEKYTYFNPQEVAKIIIPKIKDIKLA